ncbi:MAG: RNB domain-containing ribonuclease [Treponema sp.]|nr:RNB domain-containing ribonuclease [Treponema sp.]
MRQISPNCLVLYKGRPAIVTETGEKLTITAASSAGFAGASGFGPGESLRVREKDIEVLHPGPLKSLAELSLPVSGDVRGAWELMESGGVPLDLQDLAELAYGDFSPPSAWAAWLLLAEGLYFTGTVHAINARSPGEVAALEEKRRGRARESQDREAFLERLQGIPRSGAARSGGVYAGADFALDPVADGRFLRDVEALARGQSEKSRTLRDLGRPETPQEAHRLLLETGYWAPWFNPYPQRWGVSLSAPEAALFPAADPAAAAGGLEEPGRDFPPRRDLGALPAFAIDSPWSTDPDDAVSLEISPQGRRTLYVHVADPALAVYPGSPADLEARARGATLYLPEGTWRMLNEESLARFALGLNGSSPALTFKLGFDSGGAPVETEVFPSIVRVTRLSYEEADALADGAGSSGGETAALLRELFALGEANLIRRLNAGGVCITLPEVHISVSPPDWTPRIRPVPLYRSAEMVRECMLLAGEGAAAWASQRRIPFPYITQEMGELPAKPLEGLAGSCQVRRCMRPRSVSARPGCHWGLGLSAYTQVTSPLRRYTDLLAHQQIRAWLNREAAGNPAAGGDGTGILSEEEVLFRLAQADAAAQALTQVERASRAHWTAVYLDGLLKNPPEPGKEPVWEAVALEKRGNNTGIIIPDLALETQIGGAAGAPNETLRVRLKSVKIPEAAAVFAPL